MQAITKGIFIGLLAAAGAVGVFILVSVVARQEVVEPSAIVTPNPSIPRAPTGQPMAGNYPANGPMMKDLRMRWSNDGNTFGDEMTFVERAGVPSIIADANDRLVATFQWFPENNTEAFDRIAVAFSDDEGVTWTDPELIVVNGATWEPNGLPNAKAVRDGSYLRPFDPTITLTEDGRYRLYFTSVETGVDDMLVYSAISDDAITYALEDGERLNVANERNYDSAALLLDDVWHLMTPGPGGPGSVYHTESIDGLNFPTPVLIGESGPFNWTGNLLAYDEGMRFYGSSRNGLWWAYSADGLDWTEPTLIEGDGGENADPAIVRAGESYLILYTSQPVR